MELRKPVRGPIRAQDIMTKNPVAVEVTSMVQEVSDKLFAADVRHIPVVSKGELVGIVSDRDLRSYLLPRDERLAHADVANERLRAPVSAVLQGDVISVHPDTEIQEVIDLMVDQKIGAVPVVESTNNRLLGIISYVDVLRVASEYLP